MIFLSLLLWRTGDSDVNPNAAPLELKFDLLRIGPFCRGVDGTILSCSANASRTQRAGVWELQYMGRGDRSYCSIEFSRTRVAPQSLSEEECRSELENRTSNCYLSCDNCKAVCTDPTIRDIANTYRCTLGQTYMGVNLATHVSDLGQDIMSRHGAVRKDEREPTPESSWAEIYHTLVQNDIASPIVPRQAVSCRKSHRESTYGHYVPGLNSEGEPVKRTGFFVPCNTDSDCYSRCPEHPITGMEYVCTHGARFYTYAGTSNGSDANSFYTIDDPDDGEFDLHENTTYLGVCTDAHYAYQFSGCTSPGLAQGVHATALNPP